MSAQHLGVGLMGYPPTSRKVERCERKGHKWVKQTRRGYDNGNVTGGYLHFRCTSHAVEQERDFCRRCKQTSEWATVDDRCINSLTMDSASMSKLRRDGVLWR